ASRERGGLSVVARQPYDADVLVLRLDRLQRFDGSVAAAIVDVDDFRSEAEEEQDRREAAMQFLERAQFIEELNDDRQPGARLRVTRHSEGACAAMARDRDGPE